jgi:hypothetical protein
MDQINKFIVSNVNGRMTTNDIISKVPELSNVNIITLGKFLSKQGYTSKVIKNKKYYCVSIKEPIVIKRKGDYFIHEKSKLIFSENKKVIGIYYDNNYFTQGITDNIITLCKQNNFRYEEVEHCNKNYESSITLENKEFKEESEDENEEENKNYERIENKKAEIKNIFKKNTKKKEGKLYTKEKNIEEMKKEIEERERKQFMIKLKNNPKYYEEVLKNIREFIVDNKYTKELSKAEKYIKNYLIYDGDEESVLDIDDLKLHLSFDEELYEEVCDILKISENDWVLYGWRFINSTKEFIITIRSQLLSDKMEENKNKEKDDKEIEKLFNRLENEDEKELLENEKHSSKCNQLKIKKERIRRKITKNNE